MAASLPIISPDRRPWVVVMLKEPRPGRVKTGLGRDIGMTAAAWWFRHQCRRLLRELDDPRWRLVIALSPDAEGRASRIWPAHLPRLAQGRGDLGARMGRLFRRLPPGPVVIVGADIPALRRHHIARAFAALGAAEAVLGPAEDGGYWLIGLKRAAAPPASLFHGVRWSSRHALADTLASLPGLRIAQLERLADVDEARDLPAFRMTPEPAHANRVP